MTPPVEGAWRKRGTSRELPARASNSTWQCNGRRPEKLGGILSGVTQDYKDSGFRPRLESLFPCLSEDTRVEAPQTM